MTTLTIGTKVTLSINGKTIEYKVRLIVGNEYQLISKNVLPIWATAEFIETHLVA